MPRSVRGSGLELAASAVGRTSSRAPKTDGRDRHCRRWARPRGTKTRFLAIAPPMDLSIVWDRRESVAERIAADHQFQWAAPANYSSSSSYFTQTVYDVGRFL